MSMVEKAREYIIENKIDIADFAREVGYSRSAISDYLRDKYKSNPENIERKLRLFFEESSKLAENEPTENEQSVSYPAEKSICEAADKASVEIDTNTFFRSHDASQVLATAKACQDESGLGCIIGHSGYGKTTALQRYAAKIEKVVYIQCNSLMTRRDLISRIEKGLELSAQRGSNDERVNSIVDSLKKNKGYLIIIDEADKLISKGTIEKLEILRTIYDLCVEDYDSEQHTVGILIAGEPRLKTNILSWNERYARRIEQYYELKGLKSSEVTDYLSYLNISGDAIEELILRATNERIGCFRLLNKTLRNIKKVLNGRTIITGKIITEASSMMML